MKKVFKILIILLVILVILSLAIFVFGEVIINFWGSSFLGVDRTAFKYCNNFICGEKFDSDYGIFEELDSLCICYKDGEVFRSVQLDMEEIK